MAGWRWRGADSSMLLSRVAGLLGAARRHAVELVTVGEAPPLQTESATVTFTVRVVSSAS